ncbi:MAG TPA: DUF2845 domain-containing protein [Polyangiaceae bacterium]|jgi:hypothetical protein|nr:DUF2845 domain-containing protein [Polyangiaceae bacterium]
MQHWKLISPGLCLAPLLLAGPAQAEDSMRCGDRLVVTGSSMYDVRSLCGEPDAQTHRVEYRTVRERVGGPCAPGHVRCGATVEHTVEVNVDEWVYDFGTRRFVQELTFEEGQLLLIRGGGYGHKND